MYIVFFLNDTATTEIYTLSLLDALPISTVPAALKGSELAEQLEQIKVSPQPLSIDEMSKIWSAVNAHYRPTDRKSTRLNSSHANISYAVFCLKKKTCGGNHSTLSGLKYV